jgi:hypothetical protein
MSARPTRRLDPPFLDLVGQLGPEGYELDLVSRSGGTVITIGTIARRL